MGLSGVKNSNFQKLCFTTAMSSDCRMQSHGGYRENIAVFAMFVVSTLLSIHIHWIRLGYDIEPHPRWLQTLTCSMQVIKFVRSSSLPCWSHVSNRSFQRSLQAVTRSRSRLLTSTLQTRYDCVSIYDCCLRPVCRIHTAPSPYPLDSVGLRSESFTFPVCKHVFEATLSSP